MPGPTEPRPCRESGCDTRVILARRPGSGTPARWVPLEATDRDPASDAAIGCLVVVAGAAWRPRDLTEHFMTRFEVAEPEARDLVAGYPHHRPHTHQHHPTTEKGHHP